MGENEDSQHLINWTTTIQLVNWQKSWVSPISTPSKTRRLYWLHQHNIFFLILFPISLGHHFLLVNQSQRFLFLNSTVPTILKLFKDDRDNQRQAWEATTLIFLRSFYVYITWSGFYRKLPKDWDLPRLWSIP